MHVIATLIVGLIVGALAKLIDPGKNAGGLGVTMLLGVSGALIAGLLGHALGWYSLGAGPGLLASIVGAVALLVIYRAVLGRRAVV